MMLANSNMVVCVCHDFVCSGVLVTRFCSKRS